MVEKIAKTAKVVVPETETESKKKNRSFKVKLSEEAELYGRYNGDSPYQAANKALSEIIRNKVKGAEAVDGDITFYLVESTKGSAKKTHQYVGKRVQLDSPVEYKVGDQIIIKKFKNLLKKVKRETKKSDKEVKKTETKKEKVAEKVVDKPAAKKVAGKKVAAKKVAGKKVATKKVAA